MGFVYPFVLDTLSFTMTALSELIGLVLKCSKDDMPHVSCTADLDEQLWMVIWEKIAVAFVSMTVNLNLIYK